MVKKKFSQKRKHRRFESLRNFASQIKNFCFRKKTLYSPPFTAHQIDDYLCSSTVVLQNVRLNTPVELIELADATKDIVVNTPEISDKVRLILPDFPSIKADEIDLIKKLAEHSSDFEKLGTHQFQNFIDINSLTPKPETGVKLFQTGIRINPVKSQLKNVRYKIRGGSMAVDATDAQKAKALEECPRRTPFKRVTGALQALIQNVKELKENSSLKIFIRCGKFFIKVIKEKHTSKIWLGPFNGLTEGGFGLKWCISDLIIVYVLTKIGKFIEGGLIDQNTRLIYGIQITNKIIKIILEVYKTLLGAQYPAVATLVYLGLSLEAKQNDNKKYYEIHTIIFLIQNLATMILPGQKVLFNSLAITLLLPQVIYANLFVNLKDYSSDYSKQLQIGPENDFEHGDLDELEKIRIILAKRRESVTVQAKKAVQSLENYEEELNQILDQTLKSTQVYKEKYLQKMEEQKTKTC